MQNADPMLVLVRRADAARREGRPGEAARELEQALRSDDFSQKARVEAYLALGKCYDELGRRRDAQACYRRILALTDDWNYREPARRYFRKPFRAA
ncbi:MAG: tetratricopeptide repeat protein [Bryobacterales bacterium]|nr:tetratricopeptide repeat protein [Bryobacterales bacterium]